MVIVINLTTALVRMDGEALTAMKVVTTYNYRLLCSLTVKLLVFYSNVKITNNSQPISMVGGSVLYTGGQCS